MVLWECLDRVAHSGSNRHSSRVRVNRLLLLRLIMIKLEAQTASNRVLVVQDSKPCPLRNK